MAHFQRREIHVSFEHSSFKLRFFSANFTILGRSSIRMTKSRPQPLTIVVCGDSLLIRALPFISLCPANT
jgi:hypothetical protein